MQAACRHPDRSPSPRHPELPSAAEYNFQTGNIDVGNAADYAHVEASVTTGDLNASPFGETRDGLFRSFEKSGNGKYRLTAHVGAGDLTLK